MKFLHSSLSGVLLWILIFATFTFMSHIPTLQDSETLQYMILFLIIAPLVIASMRFYPFKNVLENRMLKGFVMISVCTGLDAIITVPYVIIPQYGGSYIEFFTNPLFVLTGLIIMIVVYFYNDTSNVHSSRLFKS